MTPAQLTALAAHIRANATPAVVAALAIRNDVGLAEEYNKPSAVDAWRVAMTGQGLWDAMTLTEYDGISQASKRELWLEMMRRADTRPVDMSMARYRNALTDIWVHLPSGRMTALLTNCVEKLSVFETVYSAPTATTAGVTAARRTVVGPVSLDDISDALNRNP